MKTIIFGAGEMTLKFLDSEKSAQYDIQAIADNNKERQGTELLYKDRHYSIIAPEEIMSYDFEMVLITIWYHGYQIDITNQLIDLNVPFEKIRVLRNEMIMDSVRLADKAFSQLSEKAILFDSTSITQYDHKTGIQRVVRELYRNMQGLGADVFAVQYASDKWITSREFDGRIKNDIFDNVEYKTSINNRTLFMTDACWYLSGLFDSMRETNRVCFIVYDLIPILYPELVTDVNNRDFEKWMRNVLSVSSKCICISQSVADDLIKYYKSNKFDRMDKLDIHIMHLGFNIPELQTEVRNELQQFVSQAMTFLIVGTVEPRKNHFLLLKSLKKVFEQCPDQKIQLLILGKDGWKNEAFKKMYETDDVIKDRVLWIKDASDGEVQWAYRECAALVYPPKTEGYGLPLVEAAHFGLPILCSDIPVFHEVVGDNADYFNVDDVDDLSKAILHWVNSESHPDSSNTRIYTWKECAAEVLDILNDKTVPYAVLS